VVKAILMDAEARDPAIATSPNFGIFREPVVRTMHLAKLTRMNRSGNLVWWDYGNYFEDTLQMPLNAPTVFNFYRPDYSPPGSLDRAGLDGPAFEIANSYTMVSLPNRFWNIADRGFRVSGRYQFTPDYGNFMPYLEDSDVLLDYLNVVVCAGGHGCQNPLNYQNNLANTAISDPVEKVTPRSLPRHHVPRRSSATLNTQKHVLFSQSLTPFLHGRKCLRSSRIGLHHVDPLEPQDGQQCSRRRPSCRPEDRKTLVCLYLHGGIDSYNVLVPNDADRYSDYAATRTNLALPQQSLLPLTQPQMETVSSTESTRPWEVSNHSSTEMEHHKAAETFLHLQYRNSHGADDDDRLQRQVKAPATRPLFAQRPDRAVANFPASR
jgi:hypothetical protein